jgi:hypothetical protein
MHGMKMYFTAAACVLCSSSPARTTLFNRLSRFLANAFSSYAAIDAPFAFPFSIVKDAEFVWRRVLDLATNGHPFF